MFIIHRGNVQLFFVYTTLRNPPISKKYAPVPAQNRVIINKQDYHRNGSREKTNKPAAFS